MNVRHFLRYRWSFGALWDEELVCPSLEFESQQGGLVYNQQGLLGHVDEQFLQANLASATRESETREMPRLAEAFRSWAERSLKDRTNLLSLGTFRCGVILELTILVGANNEAYLARSGYAQASAVNKSRGVIRIREKVVHPMQDWGSVDGVETSLDHLFSVLLSRVEERKRHTDSRKLMRLDGRHNVVLSPAASGWLFHEICHLLEADFYSESIISQYWKLGDLIGPSILNITDYPLKENTLDDEGIPCRALRLVEKGALVGLIDDRRTGARFLGGNGFREDHIWPIQPRSRALVITAKPVYLSQRELLSAAQTGAVLHDTGITRVDYTTGVVRIMPARASMIVNGDVGPKISGFSIFMSAKDLLGRLSSASKENETHWGICSKMGQNRLVSASSPACLFEGVEIVPNGT